MAYKKRFWIVLFAFIGIPTLVLLAGIYRFNFTNADIYMELADGEVVQYDDLMREVEENGYSKVMLSLFSIRTKEDLSIQLPEQSEEETPVWVPLARIDSQATQRSAVGDYTLGEERGTVSLNYDTIRTLSPEADNQTITFVAPFSVSNQGSGIFYYLGIFEQNNQKFTVLHKDSFFLGDRINIVSIEPDNQDRFITVEYTERNNSINDDNTSQQPLRIRINVAQDPVSFTGSPDT